jgi:DNA-binding NtrC family response regulator
VLLEGETGTGKEAAALAIHQEGERAEQPFVVVDCGALPHNLLESELFGHEQGAFTGATSAREGAFEAAEGGTVFLDEIGELAIDLQPKLLRVIERREVKRLGSSKYRPVDVRIIAATHRDLRAMVNERELRSDLFYRLAVLIIRLPALRERREDVPLISEKLLEELGVEGPDAALLRDPAFLAELARHEWPGNVRELRNHLERCLVMQEQTRPAGGGEPREDLTLELDRPLKEAREAWSRAFERRYLTRLLERAGGNVSAAARVAQVDRMYLYRLLWRHGLK